MIVVLLLALTGALGIAAGWSVAPWVAFITALSVLCWTAQGDRPRVP